MAGIGSTASITVTKAFQETVAASTGVVRFDPTGAYNSLRGAHMTANGDGFVIDVPGTYQFIVRFNTGAAESDMDFAIFLNNVKYGGTIGAGETLMAKIVCDASKPVISIKNQSAVGVALTGNDGEVWFTAQPG
jgi:hypothetical protein